MNADENLGVPGALLTHNLFAYCVNNPVILSDPDGDFFQLALAGGLTLGGGSGIGAAILGGLAAITPVGWVAIGVVAVVAVGAIVYANSKSKSGSQGLSSSTPANPGPDDDDPFDPRNPKRWNKNSTQTTSKTLYNKNGYRLDVENPNPSQRPGQLHVQVGNSKYLFNNLTGQFYTAAGALAPKAVQELLSNPEFVRKVNDGLRLLGLPSI